MASEVERRPGPDGSAETEFPKCWGSAPRDAEERAAWIKANVLVGIERRDRGEIVDWLDERALPPR